MNIKGIYQELINNGFYKNISIKICKEEKNDDSIEIPEKCNDRLSGIEKINVVEGFDIYISPCRIGRKSKYCSNKIVDCSLIKDNETNCPICFVINDTIINPCLPLNSKIKVTLNDNFLLLPNAYPYLEHQFLITTNTHYKQMNVFINDVFINELFTIFLQILNYDDVLFFNGICGNSLEHFHCQYTTSQFPFLQQLEKTFSGFYNIYPFRAYVLNTSDYTDMLTLINKINDKGLTFNFITRKSNESTLQIIFFIRNCISDGSTLDLNFGATELSGIIVGTNINDITIFTKENIDNYINLTNNITNYIDLTGGEKIKKNLKKSKIAKYSKNKRKYSKKNNYR